MAEGRDRSIETVAVGAERGDGATANGYDEEIIWKDTGDAEEAGDRDPDMRQRPDGKPEEDSQDDATSRCDPLGPFPIMPMSSILTDVAARRILERDGDDPSDPVAQSAKARRFIKENLDGIAPEPVTQGLAKLSTKAIFATNRLSRRLADMNDVRTKGRREEDIATLGTSFLARLAGMLSEVSDIASDGLLGDAAESIRKALVWHEEGYYEMASVLGHAKAYEASKRVRREFDSAWEWLYANVFSTDVAGSNLPAWREFWRFPMTAGTLTDAVSELGDTILGLGRLAQGLPTRDDLRELPHGELLRLSELLDEFAEVTQSWPEVYPCEPVVAAAGDDWADSQYWNLLGGIRTGNRQDATERVTEMDENGEEQVFYRVKTNRQMGLAFSAWTEDCHEVASTIEFWAKEKGGDGTALMVRDMMTPDERGELERRRKKAWDWLGAYAFMMVC